MIAEKKVNTVGIEPRPLAQESDAILTELTHHLLFKSFKCLFALLY